jgi:hypothetical protein
MKQYVRNHPHLPHQRVPRRKKVALPSLLSISHAIYVIAVDDALLSRISDCH